MRPPRIHVRLTRFDGSHELHHDCRLLPDGDKTNLTVAFAGAHWEIAAVLTPAPGDPDAMDGRVVFRVEKGEATGVAVGIEWPVSTWSRDHFVMLPAAAYNGNRYPSRPYQYPPMVHKPADIGPGAPVLVTDIPRLSHEDGTPSRVQILTGDETTPCISYFDPRAQAAAIWLTEQGSRFGNHGLTVEESFDRSSAVLRIEAPGVRRDTLYTMVNTATPSWDRGAAWAAGTEVCIRFRFYVFEAKTVQDLYDRFARVRRDFAANTLLKNDLPFAAAWKILEEKYRRDNWCEDGYFRVGTHEAAAQTPYQDWQVGWVGGGMVPFPLLLAGQPESRQRAMQNIEWMFAKAQHPSGLFHAVHGAGISSGDGYGYPGTERWHMVRKQGDALYFLIKSFVLLRAQDQAGRLPAHWSRGTRRLADCLVSAFRKFGQLGQYLDYETGDVVVGGSSASAIVPAALALAGQFFENPEYLEVADALAHLLDENDVRAGVTTGGPGEILKCPDSESAFAMLESFVVLHEVTGNPHWLDRAEAMVAQCLTWIASYDYVFPKGSWFERLGIRAAGSVWANVQNKHSAPGICTLSGDSLFKLFRSTGKKLYLEQIRESAHNLTQYVSRADRPVGAPERMKPGYICERVNFSDWEGRDNIGGSLFGSCWSEVSLMLTTVELPGIYAQPDTGLLCVFDHVEARITGRNSASVTLVVRNPTAFDTEVRIFAENSGDARKVLGQAAAVRWPVFPLAAGETQTWKITVQ